MNTAPLYRGLAAGLFFSAGFAFARGLYVVGAWVAIGCAAMAWAAWRSSQGQATDEAAAAITALRLQVQELRGEAQAYAPAIADVASRVAAVMTFLQATQAYTGARQTGANGRPASPLRNPLK